MLLLLRINKQDFPMSTLRTVEHKAPEVFAIICSSNVALTGLPSWLAGSEKAIQEGERSAIFNTDQKV